jgi:hypothetical protein
MGRRRAGGPGCREAALDEHEQLIRQAGVTSGTSLASIGTNGHWPEEQTVTMKGMTMAQQTRPVIFDIAELVLDLPRRERKDPKGQPERARRKEDMLVPDSGPRDDLVPDSWGGVDLA